MAEPFWFSFPKGVQIPVHLCRISHSAYEMIQFAGISTFAKTPVNELFVKQQINQNVKEQLNVFKNNNLLTHQ